MQTQKSEYFLAMKAGIEAAKRLSEKGDHEGVSKTLSGLVDSLAVASANLQEDIEDSKRKLEGLVGYAESQQQ